MNLPAKKNTMLLNDLRELISSARSSVVSTVNSTLTMLYWNIGKRVNEEILKNERAEYGKQIVATLSHQLTQEFGKGWGERQLRHCIRFAETFPDSKIVSALRRQLSWTHFKTIIYIDDPLKRSFYTEMCRTEKWSTRRLAERIELPDRHLLQQKLHTAMESARPRFESLEEKQS
jgi:hypothetical protein